MSVHYSFNWSFNFSSNISINGPFVFVLYGSDAWSRNQQSYESWKSSSLLMLMVTCFKLSKLPHAFILKNGLCVIGVSGAAATSCVYESDVLSPGARWFQCSRGSLVPHWFHCPEQEVDHELHQRQKHIEEKFITNHQPRRKRLDSLDFGQCSSSWFWVETRGREGGWMEG